MATEERRQSLAAHRLAVLGVERAGKAPHLSPVYYVLEGGDLLVPIARPKPSQHRGTGA